MNYDEDFRRWEQESVSAAGGSKVALEIAAYFRECKDACRVLSFLNGVSFRAHNATLTGPNSEKMTLLKCFLKASRNSVYLDCSQIEYNSSKFDKCINAARNLVSVILLERIDLLQNNKLLFQILSLLNERCEYEKEVFLLCTASDLIPDVLRATKRMDKLIAVRDLNLTERKQILLDTMQIDTKLAKQVALMTSNFTAKDHKILCMNAYIYHKSKRGANVNGGVNINGGVGINGEVNIKREVDIKIEDFEDGIRRTMPLEFKQISSPLPSTRFEDIFGMREIKDSVMKNIIFPLKHPGKNAQCGIHPPRGVLIYGPTGVGKTLLSYAIANELKFRVIVIDGTRIRSKVVGESEKNVLKIFSKARANAPCVLILDQIDSLIPKRGSYFTSESTSERVISSFLVEIDGIFTTRDFSKQVFVIATTSNPENVERAVLRAGRIDEHIPIRNPNRETRTSLFKGFTAKIPNSLSEKDFSALADMSKNLTCAEIKRMCHNAALKFLKGDLQRLNFETVSVCLKIP